jgi:hypothetical protein
MPATLAQIAEIQDYTGLGYYTQFNTAYVTRIDTLIGSGLTVFQVAEKILSRLCKDAASAGTNGVISKLDVIDAGVTYDTSTQTGPRGPCDVLAMIRADALRDAGVWITAPVFAELIVDSEELVS